MLGLTTVTTCLECLCGACVFIHCIQSNEPSGFMAIKYERPKVRKGHGMRLAPVTNGKCKGQSRIA